MYNKLTYITRNTTQVLDLDTVKAHLREVSDDNDDLLTTYIGSVTDYIDGISGIGLSLLTTQWRYSLDNFMQCIRLPIYPVQSVQSVEYRDTLNVWHTVDPSIYYVDLSRDPTRITLNYNCFWPQIVLPPGSPVRVNFTAGFGDAPTSIPRDLKHAMLMIIEHWSLNRSAVVGIDSRDSPQNTPMAAESILSKYRVAAFA